jgi:hypothetical protein
VERLSRLLTPFFEFLPIGFSYFFPFLFRDGTYIHPDDPVRPLPKSSALQFLIVTRSLRSQLYDYEDEERFFYPAMEVGEVVTLKIPDDTGILEGTLSYISRILLHFPLCFTFRWEGNPPREVNITTLALSPRIYLLDSLLSDEVW